MNYSRLFEAKDFFFRQVVLARVLLIPLRVLLKVSPRKKNLLRVLVLVGHTVRLHALVEGHLLLLTRGKGGLEAVLVHLGADLPVLTGV